jgi:Skp family chaperone for outer membrane proteins
MTTKLRRGLMISTLCLASAFGAWATAQTGGKAPPPPSAVAVVDLAKLTNNLNESQTLRDRLNQQKTEYEKRLQGLKEDLQKVQQDIKMQGDEKKGTPEHMEKMFRQRELEITLKARHEGLQAQMDLAQGDIMKTMFSKIVDAVGRYGKEQGYDLVLWDDRSISAPTNPATDAQVWGVIKERRILFAAERTDITDQVLTFMNNEFKAGKK